MHNPPNPKQKKASKAEPQAFPPFIANFSLEFVDWCLDTYVNLEDLIIDNFAGSITTLLSCSSKGIHSIGLEINPVWVIYGRSRLIRYSHELPRIIEDELNALKHTDDYQQAIREILERALSSTYNDFNNGIVIIAAAILGSYRKKVDPKYGLNHSWPKMVNTEISFPSIQEIRICTKKIVDHSNWMSEHYPEKEKAWLFCKDSTKIKSYPDSFDIIITSPPYLSRLDYIVATRPEINLCENLGIVKSEKDIRYKQIGTPLKEVNEIDEFEKLPHSCQNVIIDVEKHKSKGSSSYYKFIIENYFIKMNKVFSILNQIASADAKIIMVVRDSWYKNIYINTSNLLIDILTSYSWLCKDLWTYKSNYMLASANPSTKKWRTSSSVDEKIIVMKKR